MAFKMKYGKGMTFNYGNKNEPALEFNSGLRQASKDGKLDDNPEFKNAVDSALPFVGKSKKTDNSKMTENRKAQFNKLKEKVGVIGKKIFGKKRHSSRNRKIIKDKTNKKTINNKRVSIAENLPEYKSTVKTDTTGKKSLRSYTEAYKAKKDDVEFMKLYPTQKSFETAAEAWWKTQGAGSPKKYNKKK